MHFVVNLISLLIAMAANCVNSVPYGFGNAGRQEDAVIVDAVPSFSPVASDPSYPVHSPGMFCRHRIYYNPSGSETKHNYQQREQQTPYQTYQPYLPSPEFVRIRGNGNNYQLPSHTTNYETYRTPSTSVESPQYFRRQNNEIQENSDISKYEQTGSMYEAFMVHQEYPSARTVMGYRLLAPTTQETKSSFSYN